MFYSLLNLTTIAMAIFMTILHFNLAHSGILVPTQQVCPLVLSSDRSSLCDRLYSPVPSLLDGTDEDQENENYPQ